MASFGCPGEVVCWKIMDQFHVLERWWDSWSAPWSWFSWPLCTQIGGLRKTYDKRSKTNRAIDVFDENTLKPAWFCWKNVEEEVWSTNTCWNFHAISVQLKFLPFSHWLDLDLNGGGLVTEVLAGLDVLVLEGFWCPFLGVVGFHPLVCNNIWVVGTLNTIRLY